jgi:tetratricopeptide (TPR) repeat protein
MAKGDLTRVPLAEAIRDLHVRKVTGELIVARGVHRKTLQFQEGRVVRVDSSLAEDRLSHLLVKWGLLDKEQAEKIAQMADEDPAEEVRQAEELLGAEGLREFLRQAGRETILHLFSWKEGTLEFRKLEGAGGGTMPPLDIPDLVLEGVRRMAGFDAVRERLLWANPVFKANSSSPSFYDDLSLHPREGFIFSLLDGTSDIRTVLPLSPMGEEETCRLLYAFLLLDLIRPAEAPEDLRFSIRRFGEEEERRGEQLEDIKFKLKSVYERIHELTDWQVLGLEPGTPLDQVQEAHRKLMERYKPDRFPEKIRKECRRELDIINARIGEAILSITTHELGRAAGAGGGKVVHRGIRSKEEIEEERKETRNFIRDCIRRAKAAAAKHDYHTAIQFVEQTLRRDPENPENHALYAHYLLQNPHWHKRAEAAFLRALELDPDNIQVRIQLAMLYKRFNMKAKARQHLQKVLELDPTNEDAEREMKSVR